MRVYIARSISSFFFLPTGYRFSYGKSSLSAINYKLLKDYFVSGIDASYTRDAFDEAIRWAHEVKDSTFVDADSIHEALVGNSVPGAMALCSSAFQVGAVCYLLQRK